jgi:hypothetical protein
VAGNDRDDLPGNESWLDAFPEQTGLRGLG